MTNWADVQSDNDANWVHATLQPGDRTMSKPVGNRAAAAHPQR
jgi:hypothetical protein